MEDEDIWLATYLRWAGSTPDGVEVKADFRPPTTFLLHALNFTLAEV